MAPSGERVNVIVMKRVDPQSGQQQYLFVYDPDYEKMIHKRISNGGRMNLLRTLTEKRNKQGGRIIFSEPLLTKGAHSSDNAAAAACRARQSRGQIKRTVEDTEDECSDPESPSVAPSARSTGPGRRTSMSAQVVRKMLSAAKAKNGKELSHAHTETPPLPRPAISASMAKTAHNAKRPAHLPSCPFEELQRHLPRCPLYDAEEGVIEKITPNPDFVNYLVTYFHKRPPQEVLRHFCRHCSAEYAHWIAGDG
jgi:hypothetical protein